jgi:PhnB protein
MPVNPIPEQYRGATPYLICSGAAKAIEFYKKAFGAVELFRMDAPGGMIGHAEMRIGDHAIFMLADECPQMGAKSAKTIGGTPVSIYIYVKDVDAFAKRAIDAGIKVLRPVTNQFYGDRSCGFEDPFGHSWGFATHIEDVPPDELAKRAAAMAQKA